MTEYLKRLYLLYGKYIDSYEYGKYYSEYQPKDWIQNRDNDYHGAIENKNLLIYNRKFYRYEITEEGMKLIE